MWASDCVALQMEQVMLWVAASTRVLVVPQLWPAGISSVEMTALQSLQITLLVPDSVQVAALVITVSLFTCPQGLGSSPDSPSVAKAGMAMAAIKRKAKMKEVIFFMVLTPQIVVSLYYNCFLKLFVTYFKTFFRIG